MSFKGTSAVLYAPTYVVVTLEPACKAASLRWLPVVSEVAEQLEQVASSGLDTDKQDRAWRGYRRMRSDGRPCDRRSRYPGRVTMPAQQPCSCDGGRKLRVSRSGSR